jgi:hypothetical protein
VKWQERVAELEHMVLNDPSPKNSEMLSDAQNYLRFVTTRQNDLSKQSSRWEPKIMGYEPVTYCRNCTEAFDVYHPPEDRLCENCADVRERAERGVDGNCGFALVGADLAVGEAEFVEIALPVSASKDPNRYHHSEWVIAAKIAATAAYKKLKARMPKPISYYIGPSHPDHC